MVDFDPFINKKKRCFVSGKNSTPNQNAMEVLLFLNNACGLCPLTEFDFCTDYRIVRLRKVGNIFYHWLSADRFIGVIHFLNLNFLLTKFLPQFHFLKLALKEIFDTLSNRLLFDVHLIWGFFPRNIENASRPRSLCVFWKCFLLVFWLRPSLSILWPRCYNCFMALGTA